MKNRMTYMIAFFVTAVSALLIMLVLKSEDRIAKLEADYAKDKEKIESIEKKVTELKQLLELNKLGTSVAPSFPGIKEEQEFKFVEGFYCDDGNEETIVMELKSDGTIKVWIIADITTFGKKRDKPMGTGTFVRQSTTLFFTISMKGRSENRTGYIQKVNPEGYITQLDAAPYFLTPGSCPQRVMDYY